MKATDVISEMSVLGINGFARQPETAAETLDVIKKEMDRAPITGAVSLKESQDRRQDAVDAMLEIANNYSAVSSDIRKKLQEADTLLRKMNEAASEFRRIFNE